MPALLGTTAFGNKRTVGKEVLTSTMASYSPKVNARDNSCKRKARQQVCAAVTRIIHQGEQAFQGLRFNRVRASSEAL